MSPSVLTPEKHSSLWVTLLVMYHVEFPQIIKGWKLTDIVPNSAAKALPTRPANIIQVTTGVSSRANANASTPPTDLVSPSLANSLTN